MRISAVLGLEAHFQRYFLKMEGSRFSKDAFLTPVSRKNLSKLPHDLLLPVPVGCGRATARRNTEVGRYGNRGKKASKDKKKIFNQEGAL